MKIMLIGAGGSGKSTAARQLGELTGLPVYHLDALYWRPGWVPTPDKEWEVFLADLVTREDWIIDGNYNRTLDIRLRAADVVIFFDLSPWLTTYRVIKRRLQYRGRTRPDMAEDCPEKLDWAFIKWVWRFRRDKRDGILEKLNRLSPDKTVIILRNPRQIKQFLEQKSGTLWYTSP